MPEKLQNWFEVPLTLLIPDWFGGIMVALILMRWGVPMVVKILRDSDGIPEWWEQTKWRATNRRREGRRDPEKQITDAIDEGLRSCQRTVEDEALPSPVKLEQGQLALPLESPNPQSIVK